jgi:CDP-glycerol glycerophosphotransferase (TagB/SpsB family)
LLRGGYAFSYNPAAELLSAQPQSRADLTKGLVNIFRKAKGAFCYRLLSQLRKKLPHKTVWLYNDRLDGTDNAFFQFRHDVKKRDGKARYYVCDRALRKGFSPGQRRRTLRFGSLRHKFLWLRAAKILTSFSTPSLFCPFGAARKWYDDGIDSEVIYLQHGILHAVLPHLYQRQKVPFDRVVISTDFEKRIFTHDYGYRNEDLLFTGAPRYDLLTAAPAPRPVRHILLAPSWRMHLIGELRDNKRKLDDDAFLDSVFFAQTDAFLKSPRLAAFLEKYDLRLTLQSHPIFKPYDHHFTPGSPRVTVGSDLPTDAYDVMMTDYSSIALDFVYLARPILYFVPDYDLFQNGVTHNYNKLHIPLEDAFGPLARDGDALLDALETLAAADFAVAPPYKDRMAAFFPVRNAAHREALYRALFAAPHTAH